MIPRTGEYAIVGRVLGPFPGFIVLGVNLLVLLLNMAVIALGVGPYLEPVFGPMSASWAALASVVFTTLCGILNIRTNALITGAFLALEVLALVVLTVLGLSHAARPLGPMLTHPVVLSGSQLVPTALGALGLAGSASHAYGCDLTEDYIKIAHERVDALRNGELRVRPMNKPIYEPPIRYDE